MVFKRRVGSCFRLQKIDRTLSILRTFLAFFPFIWYTIQTSLGGTTTNGTRRFLPPSHRGRGIKDWAGTSKRVCKREFDISAYAPPVTGKRNILIPKRRLLGFAISICPESSSKIGIYRINRRGLVFTALPNLRKLHRHFYYRTHVM